MPGPRYPSTSRPRLLFLAPVVPRISGNGLAMRCSLFIKALAAAFEVHLHVVPLADPRPDLEAWPELSSLTAALVVHPLPPEEPRFARLRALPEPQRRLAMLAAWTKPHLCRFQSGPTIAAIEQACTGITFEVVHVSRLYLTPYMPAFPDHSSGRPLLTLDLDDYESLAHGRFADLRTAHGERALADVERHEERSYARMEAEWLPRFDRVFLAGGDDLTALVARFGGASRFVHVPNAAALPPRPTAPVERATDGTVVRLLFVGTLSYFPNEAALRFVFDDLLPHLRARAAPRAVRLVVAGSTPSPGVLALCSAAGVAIERDAEDLQPIYEAADVVIAPVQAGGGSRIKLLEAFAHRRPVVALPAAAEGLEVRDGEHLLLATTADAFADACLRLVEQPELASRLVARAFAVVRSSHRIETVAASIRSVVQDAFRGVAPA